MKTENHILRGLLWIFLSFILIGGSELQAQETLYQSKNLHINNTGAFNDIFSIAKDPSGIFWVGSENGLYRYDGNTFDLFELMENEKNSLPLIIYDIQIYGLQLYAATSNGLFKMDLTTGKSEKISAEDKKNELVVRVLKDMEGGVWWLTNKGWVYHQVGKKIHSIKIGKGFELYFSSMLEDGDFIWVTAADNGLYKINIHDHRISELNLPQDIKGLHALKMDSGGQKFICAASGLFLVEKKEKGVINFIPIKRFGNNIYDIDISNKDTFILKDRNYLVHFFENSSGENFKKVDIQFESPETIDRIFHFGENIFLCSTDGFWIVRSKKILFEKIFSTFNIDTKKFEVPRTIVQEGKDVYLSNYNLLLKYNTITGRKEKLNNEGFLTHGLIKEKDTFWMASEGNGLIQYVIPSGKFFYYRNIKGPRKNHFICLENLDSTRIIIGGYENLYVFNKRTKKFQFLKLKHGNQNLEGLQINQIQKIKSNEFLIATNIGLMLIDENGIVLKELYSSIKDVNARNTNAFWVENSNSIWTGTLNGVLHLNMSGKVLSHFNVISGLAGNKVASMIGDGKSSLWVGTFTGLSAINLSNYHIYNYYKEDGLPSNEFNHSSYLLSKDGEIYLGTVNGFIKFNPEVIFESQRTSPLLKISKMEFGNQQKHYDKYFGMQEAKDPIKLGKGNNFVKLQYYMDPIDPFSIIKYEYKISGIHYDWITIGETPILHIDNFKKGKYDLQFRAINGMGSQEIITSSIPLIVSQYFYYETWFYVLLVSLILAIVIIFLADSLKKDRKLSEIRHSIAQDLHDEIGSYLTAISMNTDLLERSASRQQNYFNEIRKLNRRAMNSLRQNIWSLGTGSDDCQHFWDHIKSMVSEQFENFEIPFVFEEIDGLKSFKLTLQQKRYLLFALMECITNIIKHADGDKVVFQWKLIHGEHQIHIRNHYVEQESKSSTGYGLENIVDRMKNIGAEGSYTRENGVFNLVLKLKFL